MLNVFQEPCIRKQAESYSSHDLRPLRTYYSILASDAELLIIFSTCEPVEIDCITTPARIHPPSKTFPKWVPIPIHSHHILSRSILGPVLFHDFINGLDDGAECTLIKFSDDTKSDVAEPPEDCSAVQRDLDRLERWADRKEERMQSPAPGEELPPGSRVCCGAPSWKATDLVS